MTNFAETHSHRLPCTGNGEWVTEAMSSLRRATGGRPLEAEGDFAEVLSILAGGWKKEALVLYLKNNKDSVSSLMLRCQSNPTTLAEKTLCVGHVLDTADTKCSLTALWNPRGGSRIEQLLARERRLWS